MNTSNYPKQADVTFYLREFSEGNKDALDKLFPIIYRELQSRAHLMRNQFFNLETYNTTAIVHETYLKLMHSSSLAIETRSHFLYVASMAMRQILLNASIRKRALKRGENPVRMDLDEIENNIDLSHKTAEDLLLLNDALKKLEMMDERQAHIVECRFFGGMSIEETAIALHLSPSTVKRSWNLAKAWLYTELIEQ